MTKDELLSCLTDRPCEVCKFRTFRGCSKWSCVFEDKTEEWIPCEERLPEPGEYYLVTVQFLGCNGTEYREIDIAEYEYDGWNKANTVLAWCELPKPYEGRTE